MATMVSVDLGAQSGRVALGRLDGDALTVTELHRFPNVPVSVEGKLHWDVHSLYDGVLEGLRAAAREAGGSVDSIGADTWGLDFALLDRAGELVQKPVHHRDRRTEGAMEAVFSRVPARELYERTGIQLLEVNSVFQLWAMAAAGDPALDAAETLLMIPDLFHYWLSGVRAAEFTAATTFQGVSSRRSSSRAPSSGRSATRSPRRRAWQEPSSSRRRATTRARPSPRCLSASRARSTSARAPGRSSGSRYRPP